MRKSDTNSDTSYAFGFLFSLIVHLIGAAMALFSLESSAANAARAPEVFTVTLEGGEKLGGFTQVPLAKSKDVKQAPQGSAPEPVVPEEPEEVKQASKKKIESPTVVEDPEKKIREAKLKLELEKKKKEKAKKEEVKKKKEQEEKKRIEEERKRKAESKRKAEEKAQAEAREKKRQAQARIDRNKRLNAIANKMKSKEFYEGESANVGGDGFGAAKLGGKGMGGGTLASAEKVAYANALQQHVKSGWRWLTGKDRLQALVMVRILPDGTINDVKIAQSSGNSNFDDSVVRAVRKANPVPAPPAKFYRDFSAVRFVFDSHDR
jgi:colicin import membrane protein